MIIFDIHMGDVVLCDECNKDYTLSDDKGGLLFGSHGVCPKCAPAMEKSAKRYGETHFILSRAKEGETFRDFIYRVRRGEV